MEAIVFDYYGQNQYSICCEGNHYVVKTTYTDEGLEYDVTHGPVPCDKNRCVLKTISVGTKLEAKIRKANGELTPRPIPSQEGKDLVCYRDPTLAT